MTPWLSDPDVTLYHGDCLEVLRQLPDRSVHMCATSPPFYGLRDYGTGSWEGGDPGCDHKVRREVKVESSTLGGGTKNSGHQQEGYGSECGRCGARRVDRQIGLEETPDQWVESLVAVFREVRRVLRDDGTLWVEIGDSYGSSGGNTHAGFNERYFGREFASDKQSEDKFPGETRAHPTKPKDLLGQPWLLAFALRADGWYLRSEIIWARPNPMPESVTDRPTKSHSTVFLLSKSPRYFWDADAIREEFQSRPQQRLTKNVDMPLGAARVAAGVQQGNPQGGTHVNRFKVQSETLAGDCGCHDAGCGRTFHADDCGCSCHDGIVVGPDGRRQTAVTGRENSEQHRDGERWPNPTGANARSVWQIPTEPTPFAHFATWPRKLVARMILAGTSERGCCPECGAPWVRDVEKVGEDKQPLHVRDAARVRVPGNTPLKVGSLYDREQGRLNVPTGSWSPSCNCPPGDRAHGETAVGAGLKGNSPAASPIPCTVLDPFSGSATTSLVARNHGRHSIGIELNEDYLRIAARRLQQLSLLAEA